ncbi:CDP-alcohol phosphatidyltransferase [[Clostridium] cellulosi]|uniref:CDP-diacylglycerol--glycerol-3-phosphate 3-phosphatidyltransferase n=1 Tax=[Clostridium] cellulosi TaxID=29343 RepID=A0A078KTU6_9FIRM|nr:MAG: CDP-diacylglycerol--glycerol-3-phosphate 3-phosphatidyltransferase [[Clostridium] cellulosi]CDZ24549.1 CDP-alcohol phosphatidyltransferase [[Clostridium] cellulosi]
MSGNQSHGILGLGIPNLLSIFRLILIPVFVVSYFSNLQYSGIIAAGVLILSGLTDIFDGIIARKFNMVSKLGKILDPLADKLTQATVCVCLVIKNVAPIWILCILILKEFVMIGAGANIIRKGKEMMSSKWFGKLGTVVFYFAMILIIAFRPSRLVIYVLLILVLVFMLFSLVMYIPYFFKVNSK